MGLWLRCGADGAAAAASPVRGATFSPHIAAAFYFGIPFWYGRVFPFGHAAG
jgi:hypothetical protein